MTTEGHRHERIAEEIRHEVSSMIAGELKDPRIAGLVTVTEVRVSPDLRHARIYVSVLGSPEDHSSTIAGLQAAAGFVRREIGTRLQLRRSPEMHFVLDTSGPLRDRIDELLRDARKQEPS
jgi:ribosome-binding factor A